MARQVFLGIDLSLRSLGLCAIPSDWNGDFEKLSRTTLGIDLSKKSTAKERIQGRMALAADVRRYAVALHVTHVCYEDTLPRDAFQIKASATLLGHVERELAKVELVAEPVNQSTARSYLLGKLPKSDRKKVTLQAVDDLTDVFNTGDEKDAWVTLNCFMARFPGVFTYWKAKPEKPKRARKAASAQGSLDLGAQ